MKVLFANAILPQIKGKIDEIEAKDLQKFTIAVDFKVKTTFTDLNETRDVHRAFKTCLNGNRDEQFDNHCSILSWKVLPGFRPPS